MAIIQSSYNDIILNAPQTNQVQINSTDEIIINAFIKILNPFKTINTYEKLENIDIQIYFYSNYAFKFINFEIKNLDIGSDFDPIEVKGYTQTLYKINLPTFIYNFNFEFFFDFQGTQYSKIINFDRDFKNLFNISVDFYNQGSYCDDIINYFLNTRNLKIFYNLPVSELNALYFYDDEDPTYISKFPVNYFKFSDYNRKAIDVNNFNELFETNDLMKFSTRLKCAYYTDYIKSPSPKLFLSPFNHYKIVWEVLKLVNKVREKYPNEDFYKFYQANMYNQNETITTTLYLKG